jgi:putative peptidoglycan binding protein
MRITTLILGLTVVAGTVMTAASAEAPLVANGCYEHQYAKGVNATGYAWVRISVEPGEDRDRPRAKLNIKYGHTSMPAAEFGTVVWCLRDGASIVCPAECGGGTLRLRPLIDDHILVEADGFLITESSASTLLLLDNGTFRFIGTHVLQSAPAEHCSTDKTKADDTRVLFQPGDYHPRVTLINRQLAKLGFLSAPSDPLYTRETAAAMKAFQLSMGYEPTGLAGSRSLRALSVRALTTGTC